MKTLWRVAAVVVGLALGGGGVWSACGQPRFTAEQLVTLGPPLDRSEIIQPGNFWLLCGPLGSAHPSPPLPCLPLDLGDPPVYRIAPGHYLIDDSSIDYEARRQQAAEEQALRQLESRFGLGPLSDNSPMDLGFPEGTLWLEPLGVDTNLWLAVHGAVAGQTYMVASTESLFEPITWLEEGTFVGTNADFTLAAVSVGMRTNSLFLRAYSCDANAGLPLFWQLYYFNQTGVDPNGDPDGDGWTTLQEWLNGTDPTLADQPFKVYITRPAANSVIP